tara:strand:+ start:851 stop:2665 length:1815 start_codon:yes stop_codon:yes gene_type:complete
MENNTFFNRLKGLFSTSTIVRRIGDNKLKVVDINKTQAKEKLSTNRLIDRFSKLHSTMGVVNPANDPNFHTLKLQLYGDYEVMDEDSIISAALDIYSDESTLRDEYGDVLTINSSNDEIKKILHNLFYDVINIEFNLWPWVRNMCKYGDFYLKLDIAEKIGIIGVMPISSYEMYRHENFDPENPELVQFIQDASMGGHSGYNSKVSKVEYDNYEIAHFRLLSDTNFLPYGKSMIEPARKCWKQLTLMEDAMMIHRIMRAPEKRIFKVDIGNIPPAEVDTYMQRVINKSKKTPFVDSKTGQYDLKYNMNNMMEDFYLPVRGGQSGTEIDTLGGMEWTGIDDVNYLKERMFAALKIPKAFIGYEEGVEGKATLAAQDVRFARTIERIQRTLQSELTKIAIVHLYSQGYTNEDLADFSLQLTNPSTIYQQEQIELWNSKIQLAREIKDTQILSEDWVYKNVFELSDDDIAEEKQRVRADAKERFRKAQLEQEGNDPEVSKEALGTPHTLAFADPEQEDAKDPSAFESNGKVGRPDEGPKAGQQTSARGRDPLGKEIRNREGKLSNNIRSARANPLTRESNASIAKNLLNKSKNTSILNENSLLDDNI